MEQDSVQAIYKHYTGFLYEGNYAWGAAMNLCWNELAESVIKSPIGLDTNDPEARFLVDHFNHPVCTTQDLDAESYYVKAGVGKSAVDAINAECRAKFPQKSFGDLKMDLAPLDLIAYAYFLKKVTYEVPFTICDTWFDQQRVAGFKAEDDKQRKTVRVLKYISDDQFIIQIALRDKGDELILVKGYDTQHPAQVLEELNARDSAISSLADEDSFRMPLLKLQYRRDYTQLEGKSFLNKGWTGYFIGQMFEDLSFELDETGARVENQAVITAERGAFLPPKNARNFFLDKPFWVIMKRMDSVNPYLLLGVNNTTIMQLK